MKNILSEISQQEKNRILEMHKAASANHYLSEQDATTTGKGGPLVGGLIAKPDKTTVKYNDTINFVFNPKNAGDGPITIERLDCRSTSYKFITEPPITIPAGETKPLQAQLILKPDTANGTKTIETSVDPSTGMVGLDSVATITTDSGKKYTAYFRGEITIQK
jgi:hypothetical protein